MFSIFKSKSNNTSTSSNKGVEVLANPININNYPEEVLEIHNEFNIAADKLLEEANNIIAEAASKNINNISRLEALGFKQASQVTELKPLQEKANLSKEQLEFLNYYRKNYPFNKFITEDQVKIICHKYNLVCGDVNRFKGFVPEKNLKQIESFKLKDTELRTTTVKFYPYGSSAALDVTIKDAVVKSNTYVSTYYHLYKKLKIGGVSENGAFQSDDGINFYGSDEYDLFGLKSIRSGRFEFKQKNLQICAPVKDMDISGLELVEGYKLQKKHIPDPVVLQPVNGGYLIITAWGDEVSDPLVVNEINN